MNEQQVSYPVKDRWSLLWLVIATVLSICSQTSGKWLIPVAGWLCVVFYIRFFRSQRHAWLAYLLTAVSIAIVTVVMMPSILGELGPTIVAGAAILGGLPLLADRLLVRRLPGFTGTLAFPLAWTTLEYINTATNPLGNYGGSAYMLYNDPALLQLASLTGMWGLSFLTTWFGAVINWAWERGFAPPKIWRGAAIYAGILLLVVVYGQARLWFAPTPAQTVRAAGFTMVDWRANQDAMNQAFANDLAGFRQMMEQRYQLYFDATRKEAGAGAKIISWPENAVTVAAADEPALVARLSSLAKQQAIYLAVPMMVLPPGDAPYANKLLIFDPQGQTALEHYKYGGTGMEGNRINGDSVLRTTQTPFGVISGIICWDSLVQNVVAQSGRNGTDILLTPSLVFRDVDPMFAQASVMRAIENGVSVIHVSDSGLSLVIDPYGRVLAAMDHYPQGERALVAQVPTQGVPTFYPLIGDLFAWLAIAGLLVLIGVAILRWRMEKRANTNK